MASGGILDGLRRKITRGYAGIYVGITRDLSGIYVGSFCKLLSVRMFWLREVEAIYVRLRENLDEVRRDLEGNIKSSLLRWRAF